MSEPVSAREDTPTPSAIDTNKVLAASFFSSEYCQRRFLGPAHYFGATLFFDASGGGGDSGRQQQQDESGSGGSAEQTEFAFRLHLYKAKVLLLQEQVRPASRGGREWGFFGFRFVSFALHCQPPAV